MSKKDYNCSVILNIFAVSKIERFFNIITKDL